MDIEVEYSDIRLARFAALLHDIGHQPFSHALDKMIPDPPEKYSSAIAKNVFASVIEKAEVNPNYVVNLIEGKSPFKKPFLSSLINGQLDVDKFDYLLRDSLYAGVKYGIFDLDRLLDSGYS
jgi:HD superfamily phosphohydrolase